VEGIVAECGGTVSVTVASEEGAAFRISLPLAGAAEEDRITVDGSAPAGTESILIVEDEEGVRDLLVELLEGAGYRVCAAGCGLAALETADALDRPVDLLIADLVLPDIGGAELRDLLVEGRPEMRTLFVSGYTAAGPRGVAALEEGDTLLPKPFSGEVLLRHVRAVLDG
jgi:DNA-binding response OmpR family regulator